MSDQISQRTLKIIGHRGAAGEAFENSLEGFQLARDLNLDAIEFDIRLHNEELWVIHDHILDRLTSQSGDFEDLKNPEIVKLRNGSKIPRLTEVLDLLWGVIPVNIEIKTHNTVPKLLEILSRYPVLPKHNGFPWLLVSSFDHQQLMTLRTERSDIQISPITHGLPLHIDLIIDDLKPYSWHMDDEYLHRPTIEHIVKRGVPVFVYTINKLNLLDKLRAFGVSGIFTDQPSTFLEMN
jgi:glycerophosphoryl diester phosphodiesterase